MSLSSVCFLLALVFIFPRDVSAHLPGQPAFFKVNGIYANYYHVSATSLSNFNVPHDQAPENYLVGEQIIFEVDMSRLEIVEEKKDTIKMYWDYGNGIKAQGRTTNHIYKKIGTYILTVHIDDGQTATSQLLESIAINIIPEKDYPLPKAILEVNAKQSKDPLVDILYFDLQKSLKFDGSKSYSKNSQIISYLWDFGDGKSGRRIRQEHEYQSKFNKVFPVLRIRDNKGFFADTYVQINHKKIEKTVTPSSPPLLKNFPLYLLGIAVFLIGGVLFGLKQKQ